MRNDRRRRSLFSSELRQHDARHRAIIQTAMDGFWMADVDGRLLDVNDTYCRMSGYSASELLGMRISDLVAAESASATAVHIRTIIASGEDRFLSRHRRKDGSLFEVEVSVQHRVDEDGRLVAFLRDVTQRRNAEEALRASEDRVRAKLNAILSPEGDVGELGLKDAFDIPEIQRLMDDLFRLTGIGASMVDARGGLLVTTGMQEICERFHRAHPGTARKCAESDRAICEDLAPGTYKVHQCGNNLRDAVTPLLVDGKHLGNLFLGQFLYDDEPRDHALFRDQARLYGFDQEQYLAAYDRVPRLSRETVATVMALYLNIAGMLSRLSFGGIRLARTLEERGQLTASLWESEEKFRVLVESASEGILVVQDERITYANPQALRFFAVSSGQIGSYYYLDFTHPDDLEMIKSRYRRLDAGETLENREIFRIIDTAGAWMWVEGYSNEITWGGKPARLIFLTEVTKRKQAEEEKDRLQAQLVQAQKMESVGRLAGGVAHDFNNMLGVILGHAELALDHAEGSEPLRASLTEIRSAARRSADLTRQLLAFARRQTVTPKVLDLNEAIAGMLQMLQRMIGEQVRLIWQPRADLWTVRMDPSQIDQILANLCVNARDAIPDVGTVHVLTDMASLDELDCANRPGFVPGDYVLLSVSDDGCGMDGDTMAHLFEPFFTTKGPGNGTGLGLATVYGAVKQNRGFIGVTSEPGRGTTVTIYLPRTTEGSALAVKPVASASGRLGHETVLLVEDEAAILKLAATVLRHQGYCVHPAATPGEALRIAREHDGEIHLLVTDVIMPEMNGRDLAKSLIALHPRIKRLYMSGYTGDIIAQYGIVDEGMRFIQKPFSTKDFAARVRETLDSG
jgi:PAS domain S-box-containing protein